MSFDKQTSSANEVQVGGDHYKKYNDLQPWDVVIAWELGYLEGTALKYIARWKDKNGLEDIKKAIHFLQKLVEVEEKKQNTIIYKPTIRDNDGTFTYEDWVKKCQK